MKTKTQRFDPRQKMQGESYEIFHYLDIKTRHMEAHYHDFYEVFCFIDGEVDYWIEGSTYHLKPGDILLINPTELHKPIPRNETENYERIVLWLNKSYLSKIDGCLFEACFDTSLPTYKKIMHPSKLQKSEILSLFSSLLKEYHSEEFASNTCAYGILLQIMTILNRISLGTNSHKSDKFGKPTLITDVLLYIGEHYNEDISSVGICRRTCHKPYPRCQYRHKIYNVLIFFAANHNEHCKNCYEYGNSQWHILYLAVKPVIRFDSREF